MEKSGKTLASDEAKVTSLLADFTPLTAVSYLSEKPVDASNSQITVTVSVLEPVQDAATTTAASAPATAQAAATTTAASAEPTTVPATGPAVALPPAPSIGPVQSKLVTHTLHLYEEKTGGKTSWKAVWDHQSPAWTFEPAPALIDHLTTDTYVPGPATAPATVPAPNP